MLLVKIDTAKAILYLRGKLNFTRIFCIILLTSINFGRQDFHSAPLRSCDLRENRCSERHALCKYVNEMLLILCTFLFDLFKKQYR